MDTYMHTCMHAYMHTCMHACVHACMRAYMHEYIQTYIHTYIHALTQSTRRHDNIGTPFDFGLLASSAACHAVCPASSFGKLMTELSTSCGTIGVSWYQHCRQALVQSTIHGAFIVAKPWCNRGLLVPAWSTSTGAIDERF